MSVLHSNQNPSLDPLVHLADLLSRLDIFVSGLGKAILREALLEVEDLQKNALKNVPAACETRFSNGPWQRITLELYTKITSKPEEWRQYQSRMLFEHPETAAVERRSKPVAWMYDWIDEAGQVMPDWVCCDYIQATSHACKAHNIRGLHTGEDMRAAIKKALAQAASACLDVAAQTPASELYASRCAVAIQALPIEAINQTITTD